MGKYLVSGVAGFAGSAVAAALIARGHEVVGIDNLSTGTRENIPAGVHFYEGGCEDPTLYEKVLPKQKYAAILHLAGQGNGEISAEDPLQTLKSNTEGTLALAQYGLQTDSTRFIFASSMAVYGDQPGDAVSEEAPTHPLSFYGQSKLCAESYLHLYASRGLRPTILRLFSVYGPGQNMHDLRQGMVSIFMAMMEKEGHIHVRGNPNRYRDFVYIDDVVQAFMACLDHEGSCGQTINIGGTGKVQVGDLIEALQSLRKAPTTVEYSGATEDDIFGIYADVSAAAKYLGHESETPLKEGLKRMYAWYVSENR